MLGRPAICDPVFMYMWAGSWLIASVVIDRTKHRSSATDPIRGNNSLSSAPHFPYFLNFVCGPKQTSFWPWSWAICWPLVRLSGIGVPCSRASSGLGSNVSRCDGPPAIVSQMTRFAFGGKCGGSITPRDAFGDAAANSSGAANDARATPPRPVPLRRRNVRRLNRRMSAGVVIVVSERPAALRRCARNAPANRRWPGFSPA